MNKRYKSKGRTTRNTRNTKRRKGKPYKERKPFLRYILVAIIISIGIYKSMPQVIEFNVVMKEQEEEKLRQIVKEEISNYKTTEDLIQEDIESDIVNEVIEETTPTEETQTSVTSRGGVDRQAIETIEETVTDNVLNNYRITSYYPGDNCSTTTKTGSGKTINDFGTMKIGNKSVYTYQGKIVVAGATKELLKSGYSKNGAQNSQVKHYFSYYDTGKIEIDGVWYDFIVLDSCGASMWEQYYRLDIMVPSASDVINISSTDIIYN